MLKIRRLKVVENNPSNRLGFLPRIDLLAHNFPAGSMAILHFKKAYTIVCLSSKLITVMTYFLDKKWVN
jgi:hypothetical protein